MTKQRQLCRELWADVSLGFGDLQVPVQSQGPVQSKGSQVADLQTSAPWALGFCNKQNPSLEFAEQRRNWVTAGFRGLKHRHPHHPTALHPPKRQQA